MSGERMSPGGNASSKASSPTDEKQYPSRPLTYRRGVEEYFFGSPNPAKRTTSSSKATFQWIKGDLLGRGSHGKVYLGLIVNTGEVMAVKQVELPEATSEDNLKKIVEAIKDERETLKNLDHGNIVQYLGFEENRETLNIFLQYVSGGTIGLCLRQHGIFREEVTKHFATQILEGLTYLHAQGIIHRDLKSENILVEESGVCKISDFGISKKLAELDSRAYTMMKGTYWMAPEFIGDNGQGYDTKIDIWSLGCILFEMWTAKRPWYNQELLPVLHKLITDRSSPPMPEDCCLSPIAEDFRKRCFHSNPRKRSSASLLRIHHYLDLPTGWSFPETADVVQMMSRSVNINALGSQRRSPRSRQAESRNACQLVIHNPDNNGIEHPKSQPDTTQPTPYVSVPPPLPDIDGEQVPYSANLAPLPQTRFIDPIPNSKTFNAQYQSSLLAAPPQFHGNYTRSNLSPAGRSPSRSQPRDNDSFSDSDYSASSSTWQKPPSLPSVMSTLDSVLERSTYGPYYNPARSALDRDSVTTDSYSSASSRTVSTDYGVYYTRRAFSQEMTQDRASEEPPS